MYNGLDRKYSRGHLTNHSTLVGHAFTSQLARKGQATSTSTGSRTNRSNILPDVTTCFPRILEFVAIRLILIFLVFSFRLRLIRPRFSGRAHFALNSLPFTRRLIEGPFRTAAVLDLSFDLQPLEFRARSSTISCR